MPSAFARLRRDRPPSLRLRRDRLVFAKGPAGSPISLKPAGKTRLPEPGARIPASEVPLKLLARAEMCRVCRDDTAIFTSRQKNWKEPWT